MPILPTIPTLAGLSYPIKQLLGFAAKNSMQAQAKSEKEILQDLATGDNPSFYSEQTRDGGNEIDTYLYGVPYNTENTSNVGPSYENYLSANFPLRKHAVKTYDTHFGDTLYIDQKYKDQVLDELEQGKTVGASMGRYGHAPSYIVNTKDDKRRPYDAGGHLMQFQYDKDGNVVANMSDIYDFLPRDFEEKYGAIKEYGPLKTAGMYAMHYAGIPFIVRQNNIPVRFKEIVPEYKTELQGQLGNFLSNWGGMYDLTIPHRLTDEQIEEIFDGKQSGDEILDFMDQKGYLAPSFKKGGRIHIKKKNRGKFTEYCGGKVTEECIAKGKNSKDPKIRKRATFAANVRKWKHENGGIIKYQNPNSPLLNPHKIIENIPAREWGPRKINEDGTITEGEGTSFLHAPFQYWGNKGLGLQNEKLARDLVSDFTWMMIKNPNYNHILDKNYQSYDDAVNYLNHLEGLKKYLGLPYDTGLLMESEYKPTRLQGTNEKTYKFKSSTVPGYWYGVVEDMVTGEHNKNQYCNQSLNEFTAYRDRDEKGDFVSIYDEWDYNPAVRGGNKKLNKIIDSVTGGKPFVIYDRVYLDDHYDIPEEARGNPFITPAVVTANAKHKNGGVLKARGGTGNGFWSKLWNAVKEGGMAARDAKLGTVGAQQVRDLYSEGKTQEAQDLAKQYAKASTTGIALAGGAASTGLLGDLLVTGATTAADTFIDGDTENFGNNLVKNMTGDLIGHGIFGALKKIRFDDVLAKIKHPTWQKYYHGSPYPFDINKPYMGTGNDAGIHASKNYSVAKYFTEGSKDGVIYEFWAPKPSREFIDLHSNGLEMFTPFNFHKTDFNTKRSFHDGTKDSKMLFNVLNNEGGSDTVKMIDPKDNWFSNPPEYYKPFNITKDLTIDMGKIHWPDMPTSVQTRIAELNQHYPRYSKTKISISPEEWQKRAEINTEVSKLLAENGIPVVKYANTGYREGGGMSYMIFDPTKMRIVNLESPDILRPTTTAIGTGLGVGYGVSQLKDEEKQKSPPIN